MGGAKRGWREQEFREFESEARRLQELWGLNDWTVYVRHEPTATKTAVANCTPSSVGRIATVRLNSKREHGWMSARDAARHEMAHVLIGEVCCLAGSRCVTSDELVAAEEALVQRLTRLLPK